MVKHFLKDLKADLPLRAVVNGKGCWQGTFILLLQRCLGHASLVDYLSLRNSDDFVKKLAAFYGKNCFVCSFDMKDLYYSLGKKLLLDRLQSHLGQNLVGLQ